MKVKTIDGVEYDWTISSKVARGNKRKTSNLHQIAKNILNSKYPNMDIYEEVSFTVENKKKLYFDFYIPRVNTAVEVNGKQHYMFNPYHHKTRLHFMKCQKNDRDKKEWCEINDIRLIILPYDTVYYWESLI